ncbi:MAG TPA: Rieske (2Fe-2S) protein, partial [Pirellulales bacterium]|nr:Rieske (2Fe-2S) protein [Pirellulales bacterium]
ADGSPPADEPKPPNRRDFVATASSLAMVGGLVGGYGALGALAARYLFQNNDDTAWLFVAAADSIKPGDSLAFESPVGVRAVLTRKADAPTNRAAQDSDFLALSSVCPHLGCRVHWELQNNRFFCPCHNGSFDASGKATGGPPLAAGQSLPKYPLKIERGMLFIRLPVRSIGDVGRPLAMRGCDQKCDDCSLARLPGVDRSSTKRSEEA